MNHLSFGYQNNLYLLIPLVVVAIWYGKKWKERESVLLSLYFSRAHCRTVKQTMVARIAGLFFLILALSFPRHGYELIQKEKKTEDIIVVLDFSYSMLAQDVPPSRMERAKREIADVIDLLQGSRVGLIGFAGGAVSRMPMTSDYRIFNKIVRDGSPDQFRSQGSNLLAGVDLALDLSQKSSVYSKNILVISDGESHNQSLEAVANRARQLGVKIYCLAIGDTEGVPIPLSSGGFLTDNNGDVVITKRDDTGLIQLAKISKGAFAVASVDVDDINAIYKEGIARNSKTSLQEKQDEKIWNELFQWPLILSFLCLLYASFPLRIFPFHRFFGLMVVLCVPPVDAQEFGIS